jgi:hypothetical protein
VKLTEWFQPTVSDSRVLRWMQNTLINRASGVGFPNYQPLWHVNYTWLEATANPITCSKSRPSIRQGKEKAYIKFVQNEGRDVAGIHRLGDCQWRLVSFITFIHLACDVSLEGLHITRTSLCRKLQLIESLFLTLISDVIEKLGICYTA